MTQKETTKNLIIVLSSSLLLKNEQVAVLRQKFCDRKDDFNCHIFESKSLDTAELLNAFQSLPFMADTRWVELSDIDSLSSANANELLSLIEKLSPTTLLCLHGTKLDKRSKLGKYLSAHATLYDLEIPQQQNLKNWVQTRAKLYGIKLETKACDLLLDFSPEIPDLLDPILQQLALYAHPETTIQSTHIEACVLPDRIEPMFALQNAIGERNAIETTRLLHQALNFKQHGLMLTTLLVRHLRLLFQIRTQLDAHMLPAQIAQGLKLSSYRMHALEKQAARYQSSELLAGLETLQSTERALKLQSKGHDILLEQALLNILNQRETS